MDPAYFEDLVGRLYGLLIGLDDRIGSEQAQWLHHVIDVGEYGLALEDIAGTLAQDAIAVTDQERLDMLALADRMKLEGDLVPRALAFGHQLWPGKAQVSWKPCICAPAREAAARDRGMGHAMVTCTACHDQLRQTTFYEPAHDSGHDPLTGWVTAAGPQP